MKPFDREYRPQLRKPCAERVSRAVIVPIKSADDKKLSTYDKLVNGAGEKPEDFTRPLYGEVDYWLCHKFGWITDEEVKQDAAAAQERTDRALKTSHRYNLRERHYHEMRKTGKYVPQTTLDFNLDRNLTPSAKAVMSLILSETYNFNRAERWAAMTVSYISKVTTFSRRTVQRALTILEDLDYLSAEVCKSKASKMAYGLYIKILDKVLPGHHKKKWPEKRKNSGAPRMTQKESIYLNIIKSEQRVSRFNWSIRCMNGAFRAFKRQRGQLHDKNASTCPQMV